MAKNGSPANAAKEGSLKRGKTKRIDDDAILIYKRVWHIVNAGIEKEDPSLWIP